MEPFYILWNPKGTTPPRVEFITLDEAERAAKNMARMHPGQEFYVMQMVGKAVLPLPQEPTYVRAGKGPNPEESFKQELQKIVNSIPPFPNSWLDLPPLGDGYYTYEDY